jgi:hypothetical protein
MNVKEARELVKNYKSREMDTACLKLYGLVIESIQDNANQGMTHCDFTFYNDRYLSQIQDRLQYEGFDVKKWKGSCSNVYYLRICWEEQ